MYCASTTSSDEVQQRRISQLILIPGAQKRKKKNALPFYSQQHQKLDVVIQRNFKSWMLFSDRPLEKNRSLLQERDSSETFEATKVKGSVGFSDKILLQRSVSTF